MKLSQIDTLKIKPFFTFKNIPNNIFVLPETRIGIELEAENIDVLGAANRTRFMADLLPHWKLESDGSLRNNGKEFISQALYGQDLIEAIYKLNELIAKYKLSPFYSERTSLHIHMDVGDITHKQLAKFILLYIMFEPVLFNFSGPSRIDNVYCISFNKLISSGFSFVNARRLIEAIRQDNFSRIQVSLASFKKYTAINLKPILSNAANNDDENSQNSTGGHIEFRHSEGTHDPDYIITWINILMCLKKAAIDNEIIDLDYTGISKSSLTTYGQSVFGDLWYKHLYSRISEKELNHSVRLAERIGIGGGDNLYKISDDDLSKLGRINKKLPEPVLRFYKNYEGKFYTAQKTNTKSEKQSKSVKLEGNFPNPNIIIDDFNIT